MERRPGDGVQCKGLLNWYAKSALLQNVRNTVKYVNKCWMSMCKDMLDVVNVLDMWEGNASQTEIHY